MVSYSSHWGPLDTLCANVSYTPDSRGFLPCRMTWELPETADPAKPLTPTRCEERPEFLSVPAAGFPQRSERGRVLCEVRQTPATRAADGTFTPVGEGFYFDRAQILLRCSRSSPSPLSFSPRAVPPSGVTVHIECVDETQHARAAGSPSIGDSCVPHDSVTAGSDSLCGNPTGDRSPGRLFCHPVSNHCVMACDDDAQCPSDWSCALSGQLTQRVCVRALCEP
jgi:hypothetical protein